MNRTSFTVLIFLCASVATAQSKYTIQVLDPGAEYRPADVSAHALNNKGQAVGVEMFDSQGYAAMWHQGSATNLGSNGSVGNGYIVRSTALDISDSGTVVGYYDTEKTFISHAFAWQNGTFLDLGADGGRSSEAVAVNTRGAILGGYDYVQNGQIYGRSLVWNPDGGKRLLNPFTGTLNATSGRDINDSDVVAGVVRDDFKDIAVTWAAGSSTPTRISGLRTDLNSAASHINDRGDIIGGYYDNNGYGKGGFLILDGQLQTVTGLGGLTGFTAISDNGLVVGRTYNSAGDQSRLFLWDKLGGIRYIDSLISSPYLSTLQITDINNAGVMTGQVWYDYNYHAVLITPAAVPEPFSCAALGLGFLVCLRRRR